MGLCAVQLQGTLRIILDPLLEDKPFVGAVTVFFLQKPVSPKAVSTCPLGPGTGLEPSTGMPEPTGPPHARPV